MLKVYSSKRQQIPIQARIHSMDLYRTILGCTGYSGIHDKHLQARLKGGFQIKKKKDPWDK